MKVLKVDIKDGINETTIRLSGCLDENCTLPEIPQKEVETVRVDVGELDYINSYGSREWIRWIHALNPTGKVILSNCTPIILDYANLIRGFFPQNVQVESFNVPYYCAQCQTIHLKGFDRANVKTLEKDIELTAPCPKCGSSMEIDVIVPQFFKFLKN